MPQHQTRGIERFEPATLSLAELQFVLDHLGQPLVVALHDIQPDSGVHPNEIRKTIGRFADLEALQETRGLPWAGYDAVRESIIRYLEWHQRSLDIWQAGGPRHPSQFGWDSTGAMYPGVIGSDSQKMVRSEITEQGEYRAFAVDLNRAVATTAASSLMPWLKGKSPATSRTDKLEHDETKGLLTCGVCGFTTKYDPKRGRAGMALARGAMSKHLKTAKDEIARHRRLRMHEFKT